jgi:hypothetical protein
VKKFYYTVLVLIVIILSVYENKKIINKYEDILLLGSLFIDSKNKRTIRKIIRSINKLIGCDEYHINYKFFGIFIRCANGNIV